VTTEGHISTSAFLVNESRARNVTLSGDVYAQLWVTEATSRLWEEFSREVYPLDALELGLRNRFFLERLQEGIAAGCTAVFVNLAAGFTSYPFLLTEPIPCIEVDHAHVVAYKRQRVVGWQAEGRLPSRPVLYLAADLADPNSLRKLARELRPLLAGQPSFLLLEGLTYYLAADAWQRLLEFCTRLQVVGSMLAFDYWTPAIITNRIFQRFHTFCTKRFGRTEPEYNLLATEFVATLPGYEVVELTDVQALEERFAGTELLAHTNEILPENYALLRRHGEAAKNRGRSVESAR
jgi:O-methyltransferase involved in polyketide biosynthesis